jgi:hypothetical protein
MFGLLDSVGLRLSDGVAMRVGVKIAVSSAIRTAISVAIGHRERKIECFIMFQIFFE